MCFFTNHFIESKCALDQNLFISQSIPRAIDDYTYLIGQRHIDPDDQIAYITTRMAKLRGYIVGYRAIDSQQNPLVGTNDPIHIKDLELYTWDTSVNTMFNRYKQPIAQHYDNETESSVHDLLSIHSKQPTTVQSSTPTILEDSINSNTSNKKRKFDNSQLNNELEYQSKLIKSTPSKIFKRLALLIPRSIRTN